MRFFGQNKPAAPAMLLRCCIVCAAVLQVSAALALTGQCPQDALVLQSLAKTASFDIRAPQRLEAGTSFQFQWTLNARFPGKVPVYLVLSIPGEARFEAQPITIAEKEDGSVDAVLPGYMALPPRADAPLGVNFGRDTTRAFIPLYQAGSILNGSLTARVFDAGPLRVEAALISKTSCGEQILKSSGVKTIEVTPGAAEIVVQDRFDVSSPSKEIVSNSGRYLAQIFGGRYRIFDIPAGAMLADRSGEDVNFSPTSRFAVANVGGRYFEVIDLVSRDVIAHPIGRFVGWTNGDAFLFNGYAQYGMATLRPALISRPPALFQGAQKERYESGGSLQDPVDIDALTISYSGDCHACPSWHNTSVAVDIDNGIAVFAGPQGLGMPVYELATAFHGCCETQAQIQPYIDRNYQILPSIFGKGWRATGGLKYSHVYDPASPSDAGKDAAARALKRLQIVHRQLDRRDQTSRLSALAGAASGDWREKARGAGSSSSENLTDRIGDALKRLGIEFAPPAEVQQTAFSNQTDYVGSLISDGRKESVAKEAAAWKAIVARTQPLRQRMSAEAPSISQYFSAGRQDEFPEFPYQGELKPGSIDLERNLQGLWRWNVDGKPLWLMQLLTVEGSGAFGAGALLLLDGDPRKPQAIENLSKRLANFWSGSYGDTDDQTRIKPSIFQNRYLLASSIAAKTIVLYDIDAQNVLTLLANAPQAELMGQIFLTNDKRYILQINTDGQFFLHEVGSGKITVSGRTVDDEVIIYTPDGYYWSSYEGDHFVQLRFAGRREIYPFQQFASILKREDIIKARLAGSAAGERPVLNPPPSIEIKLLSGESQPDEAAVFVQASSPLGLTRLRLYQDGQQVREIALAGTEFAKVIHTPKAPQARLLSALATDVRGTVSAPRAVTLTPGHGATNTLYAVVAGIDTYADLSIMPLNYGKSDAQRFADALNSRAGRYYGNQAIHVLQDGDASKRALKEELTKAVSRAGPGDTILFYFAGHGAQANAHYYLAAADIKLDDIENTGLPWSEIAAIIERSKARVIAILDACHAGASGSEGFAQNDDAVAALISGAHAPLVVLAASKGRQFSLEGKTWGGGVFTYALTKVLTETSPKFDLNGNGVIEASELYLGLKSIVTRDTAGQQTPWLVRQDLIGDFPLF